MNAGNKKKIYERLEHSMKEIKEGQEKLVKSCNLLEYQHLVEGQLWTKALQEAVNCSEIVIIPAGVYWIDQTIILPSNTRIEADQEAYIRKAEGMNLLMLRNELTKDGSHEAIIDGDRNENIAIIGGHWEEPFEKERDRIAGLYDNEGSFYGVSAGFFFNHVNNLTVQDVTISKIGGFGIQIGYIKNARFENIHFDGTHADGLHINGFSENILARNIKGVVADDLVALNMYDWDNSSVAFGPIHTILCENLELLPESPYEAIRILPGKYYYDDGTESDCSLCDAIFKNVKGIKTYKMYFQTFPFEINCYTGTGRPGYCDNIYFEDIDIDLKSPIDGFPQYAHSEPVIGSIAGFELGSTIGTLTFENVNVTLHRDKYPMSYFIAIGPKSVRRNNMELFDPDYSSVANKLILKNVVVNGEQLNDTNKEKYIKEIVFDDIYQEGKECTFGKIENYIFE